MKALGTALQGQDTGAARELYMAMELSDKKWVLALGDEVRAPSRHTVQAGDTGAVLGVIAKAKLRCGLGSQARVHSCYEAGRDGFWLHRWLVGQGIANLVVDAASIEVDRRARRTKTDRTDVINLHRNLLRYHGGERRVWAVARVPTVEQEDARRPLREARAVAARSHRARQPRCGRCWCCTGCAGGKVGGRGWAGWWALHSWPATGGDAGGDRTRGGAAAIGAHAAQDARRRPPPGDGGAAGGGRDAGAGGDAAAVPAGRDRGRERLAARQGVVGVAEVSQSARGGRQCGADRQPVQQRRLAGRAGHQQGGQQAGALAAGGTGVVLAALPAARASSRAGTTRASPTAANGCAASASWPWRGGWRSHCGAMSTRAWCRSEHG